MIKTRRKLDSIVYNMHALAGLKFKRIASDLSAFRRSHQTLPLILQKGKDQLRPMSLKVTLKNGKA